MNVFFVKKNHLQSRCTDITSFSLKDRLSLVAKHKLCKNCFYPHEVAQCPFEPACKKCGESHHTILHSDNKQMFMNVIESLTTTEPNSDEASSTKNDYDVDDVDALSVASIDHLYHINESVADDTLLATAIVPTRANGRSALLKTLVDQGSTTNVMTIRACNLLRLKFQRIKSSMIGVGNTPVGNVLGRSLIEIGSTVDKTYRYQLKIIIVQTIGDIKGFSTPGAYLCAHVSHSVLLWLNQIQKPIVQCEGHFS